MKILIFEETETGISFKNQGFKPHEIIGLCEMYRTKTIVQCGKCYEDVTFENSAAKEGEDK